MLQITFESSFIYLAIAFFAFGFLSFGWLAVHVEHARHFSKIKAALSLLFGAFFLGFAIHFLLLYMGA